MDWAVVGGIGVIVVILLIVLFVYERSEALYWRERFFNLELTTSDRIEFQARTEQQQLDAIRTEIRQRFELHTVERWHSPIAPRLEDERKPPSRPLPLPTSTLQLTDERLMRRVRRRLRGSMDD